VVEKLRHAILSGVFPPGRRLVESQLCASLGVSRPSLREALRSLQAERLIEIVPNRGPQVPVLSWRDAEEIYEMRELLEGEAAARCALTISDNDIAALKNCIEAFRSAVRQNDPAEQVNMANNFFGIILRNCGNKIIEQVEAGLLARVTFLRARSMSMPDRLKKSYAEINALYNAIRDRDPRKARKAAQQHVVNARNAAKRSFDMVEDMAKDTNKDATKDQAPRTHARRARR
jgi:DNA-binding GntR family transcriptional regulator